MIALIITIVVLLILAIVAIGQAQESNIVGYAQNAASSFEEGKNNEVEILSSAENLMKELIGGDLQERLRIAFEKASFYNDSSDIEALFKEYNVSMEKIWMYISNYDSYVKEESNPIYSIGGFGVEIYDYEVDANEKKIKSLESSHKDYATVQQFKKDIVEIRNMFLNKNLEDFEQEKLDDDYWKIKGINILGKTDITLRLLPYINENARSYILIDYSEKSYIELDPETEFTIVDNKICGKVSVVTQNDK